MKNHIRSELRALEQVARVLAEIAGCREGVLRSHLTPNNYDTNDKALPPTRASNEQTGDHHAVDQEGSGHAARL